MPKFTWNDVVRVIHGAPQECRPRERAWVVARTEESQRRGSNLEQFPRGTVYTIEFEDGSSIEVDEASLEALDLGEDPGGEIP